MMKLNLLLIFGLSLLIGSCTKKAEETVLKQVSAEGVVFKESAEALSPLALMRTPLAAVATVHDQSITLQDVQPGRALQDLSQEIVDLQAAMVVGWASDKSASEAVFYGQPTPQGMALALKRLGLNLPPDLNLSYSEVTEETQGVAFVGDQWVTQDQLRSKNLYLATLERLLYQGILKATAQLIQQKVLFERAKSAGKTVEDYLLEDVFHGQMELSDEEFLQFLEAKNIIEADLNDRQKTNLRAAALEEKKNEVTNEMLREGFAKDQAILNMALPSVKISLNSEWVVPYNEAPNALTVDVFGNFINQASRETLLSLMHYVDSHPQKAQLRFRFYYLDRPVENKMVSEAAMCIYDQDPAQFWAFAKAMVLLSGQILEAQVHKAAEDLGLDFKAYKKCFYSGGYRKVVAYHLDYAEHIGVRAQPTVVFGEQVFVGTTQSGDLVQMIENEKVLVKPKGLWQRFIAKVRSWLNY